MPVKVYTSVRGAADEFIGELANDSEAVKFCYDNWTDRPEFGLGRDRPPFEIERADGSFLPWGVGDEDADDEDDDDDDDDEDCNPVVLDENVSCQRCGSHRVAEAGGKCSDMSQFSMGSIDHDGYMPDDVGIGGGDYIEFTYCLNCGQLQGKWPLPISNIEHGEDE